MTLFRTPTKVVTGVPAAAAVADWAGELGAARGTIVVDGAVAPAAAEVAARLAGRAAVTVHAHAGGEPEVSDVDALAATLRAEEPQFVVGVGGGNALNLAKAAAVMVANPGSAADYQGPGLVRVPPPPVACVPTTAGSGSEVTFSAVVTNRARLRKAGISSPHATASLAVLDERLTTSLTPGLTLTTGMDALAHAIESYTATAASPLSRAFSVQALRMLDQGLPRAIADGEDLEARRRNQLGATLAAWACNNAGVGAANALAYPLTVRFGVPHGSAITLLLPAVIRTYRARRPEMFSDLDDLLGEDLATRLERLAGGAGAPPRLGEFGVEPADVEALAGAATEIPAMGAQPVRLGAAECRAILAFAR
jgi:alcohol dehydrogenase